MTELHVDLTRSSVCRQKQEALTARATAARQQRHLVIESAHSSRRSSSAPCLSSSSSPLPHHRSTSGGRSPLAMLSVCLAGSLFVERKQLRRLDLRSRKSWGRRDDEGGRPKEGEVKWSKKRRKRVIKNKMEKKTFLGHCEIVSSRRLTRKSNRFY